MKNPSAALLARVAGVAWLVGFGLMFWFFLQFFLQTATHFDVSFVLMSIVWGFFFYGLWALLLGVRLLRRPSRRVFLFSALFGGFQILLLWPWAPLLDTHWPFMLSDITATVASVAGLIASRQSRAPSGVSMLASLVALPLLLFGCTPVGPAATPTETPSAPADLADTLPSDVRGRPLALATVEELRPRMEREPTMIAFLAERGLEPDDVLIAQARWERQAAAGYEFVLIGALRVPGVPAEEVDHALPTPAADELEGPHGLTVQDGKPVFFYTWADGTLTFEYPKGEVLYVVSASDPANAIAGLAVLP
ncbi:hypothetical protein BH23CHL7_BH23CHL7_04790 [soil metagenome]